MKITLRFIALITFPIWITIACLPAFVSLGILGSNKTEKWLLPILNWCIKQID